MSAFDCVTAARANDRPTSIDYITRIFGDSFFELHGYRRFSDDKAVIGGIAELNGKPVTVIGLEKGRNLNERMERNFGSAHPEGYRKALRLMKQAEKFHRPVICFVDTSGAYCGIGAEERGQGQAIAENLMEMMTLKLRKHIMEGFEQDCGSIGMSEAYISGSFQAWSYRENNPRA